MEKITEAKSNTYEEGFSSLAADEGNFGAAVEIMIQMVITVFEAMEKDKLLCCWHKIK